MFRQSAMQPELEAGVSTEAAKREREAARERPGTGAATKARETVLSGR